MNTSSPDVAPSPTYAAAPSSRTISVDPFASSGYTFFAYVSYRHGMTPSDVLPVYMESEAMPPPSYSLKDEPATFAMYFFKFGFLFPPFWIMGVIILFSPLRVPVEGDWLPDKTDAEKQIIIDKIRRAELRWAKRCLVALAVFILLGLCAGVALWAAINS